MNSNIFRYLVFNFKNKVLKNYFTVYFKVYLPTRIH